MEFIRGNKAILEHKADGRELHLFVKQKSGLYEYLGEYEYDHHTIVEGEGVDGNKRKVIQFALSRV